MNKFTESERAAMAEELAVNGFNSLLRLIVLHDKNILDITSAKYKVGTYCCASGSTIKSWSKHGLRGVYVERALEFAACYHLPINAHQLEPTKAIIEQWLEYDYNLVKSGQAKASTFNGWDIAARGISDKESIKTASFECLMSVGEM
ncbi:hypothetical protein CTM97_18565 [Photobacterium phosphoreum]|uniref:Uncharacterized protein n=1 Tax=Photobacterium phosphoreum TaxID=659 RepID=A0A2T3JBQ4_PHOPO|nr:hypothetical protein [Photobacterium phosphoreum]PSU19942.1 hypothetical protein CTM96_20545 [Photobacterium phosphoreum]PSU38791.1 hypothetical protein CTM97_18565 [Photobacterium phosphoreum]PSU46286.1 hypothetical protein C9J18_20685 [Photobacterium phosphoreum]